jgi:hypothetical protein
MADQNNIASFIKKIEGIKDDNIDVYIPSREETQSFQCLNLKQQKDIISSVVDGVAGVVGFTRILNKIVLDSGSDDSLKVYDRAPIAVALRVDALGSEYTSDGQVVDLNEVLESYRDHKHTLSDTETIKYRGITVDVRVPTLIEESNIVKKLEEEVKRNGDNNNKNLGSIYVYEIVKFISSVKFKDNVIDYTSLKPADKIKLIESLPLALNKLVIRFIENIRKEEREILTVDDVTIEIDPSFFDVE